MSSVVVGCDNGKGGGPVLEWAPTGPEPLLARFTRIGDHARDVRGHDRDVAPVSNK
jgi:hypothetical protein